MVPFLDLKRLNAPYNDSLKDAACSVVESGWYIRGLYCKQFEQAFAEYCGVKYAVGVGNGLDALSLMLRAAMELGRLHEGDEILVPANTYIATVLAVSAVGLKPVLVEPAENSYDIDPKRLKDACGARTRAVLVVHLYGRLCAMDEICEFANLHDLLVFEDCAQAHGARFSDGRSAGTFGSAAAFSFYPTKNLGALGDAGMVLTNDADIANIVRALGNYGSEQKYVNKYKGVNSRLDEMQAALLLAKLPHLDESNERRREIAERYCHEIKNEKVLAPELPATPSEHVWHVFVIRLKSEESRNEMRAFLEKRGIETLIHYPIPPHLQQAYAHEFSGEYPIAESMAKTILSIPMSPVLTDDEVTEVIGAINEF